LSASAPPIGSDPDRSRRENRAFGGGEKAREGNKNLQLPMLDPKVGEEEAEELREGNQGKKTFEPRTQLAKRRIRRVQGWLTNTADKKRERDGKRRQHMALPPLTGCLLLIVAFLLYYFSQIAWKKQRNKNLIDYFMFLKDVFVFKRASSLLPLSSHFVTSTCLFANSPHG
jgi:hypothetical protein